MRSPVYTEFGIDCMTHEILVISADELTRRAIGRSLTDHGHEPLFVDGRDEAMNVANSHKPRLFVIDVQGSDFTIAVGLADELLAIETTSRSIVIHESDDHWHRPEMNADRIEFLRRPFSMLEFISSVEHALSLDV